MGKKDIFNLKAFKERIPPTVLEKGSAILKAIEIRSLKKKTIFLFLILAIIPLLVMRVVVYPKAQKALEESLIQNLQGVGY